MSFESPWMLLGLLAVAGVIWLHFSHRRRRKLPFPATALLLKVARRRAPRLKLRSLLLLVLRILLVIALALALSRPGLFVRRPGGLRSGMALAQVILVDNSMSMGATVDGGTTAFEKARGLAQRELERLRPGDASALLLTAPSSHPSSAEVTFDLDGVKGLIEGAPVGFAAGDIAGSIRRADRLLEDSPLPQREVVLITDLAEGGWEAPTERGVGFRVIGVSEDPHRSNASVEEVHVATLGDGVVREATVEARIANHGLVPLSDLEVMLYLDDSEAARGRIDVPAGGVATKSFHHRFAKEGVHRGSVRIARDGFPADDIRHFSVSIRKVLQVLVVNGDPRPGSYQDETFYLQRALATPTPREVPIKAVVVDMETAAAATLGGYDAVVLAGVDGVPSSFAARLDKFVGNGGGVLIAPKEGVGKLESLSRLLPGKVRSVRRARKTSNGYPMGKADRSHPVFSPFEEGPTGLEGARVRSHLLVEPDPSSQRRVLVELKGGLPLLLEKEIGNGKVMLLCTTVDRDWTDLPIRPGYMPLVQRTVRHLAGRLGDDPPTSVEVFDPVELEVTEGMRNLVVVDPKGGRVSFERKQLEGKTSLVFDNAWIPGPYRVWAKLPGYGGTRELEDQSFVVVGSPKESDLEVISAERDSDVAAPVQGVEGKLPVWPYLLFAAVVLYLLETWLAGVSLRRSHRKKQSAQSA